MAGKGDELLARMKQGRGVDAVLKVELSSKRASNPQGIVIALEGKDDVAVYQTWIHRIKEGLPWVPMVCGNKDKVLALRRVLQRDTTGLEAGVYFIMDRDFDDMKGGDLCCRTFLTGRYSVENYLVADTVVEMTMNVDFDLHEDPGAVQAAVQLYRKSFQSFLEVVSDICFRIYYARKLGVKVVINARKIDDYCEVSLEGCKIKPGLDVSNLIDLQDSPPSEILSGQYVSFFALDPSLRFRGKFLFHFFRRWMQVAEDARKSETVPFAGAPGSKKVNNLAYSNMSILASRSPLPEGLTDFVAGMSFPEAV